LSNGGPQLTALSPFAVLWLASLSHHHQDRLLGPDWPEKEAADLSGRRVRGGAGTISDTAAAAGASGVGDCLVGIAVCRFLTCGRVAAAFLGRDVGIGRLVTNAMRCDAYFGVHLLFVLHVCIMNASCQGVGVNPCV
jgi:hypothetical protein